MNTAPMYMSRRAASDYLRQTYGIRCAPQTLAKYASTGGGPEFTKCGMSAIYAQTWLDDWATSKIGPPRASTSAAVEQPAR